MISTLYILTSLAQLQDQGRMEYEEMIETIKDVNTKTIKLIQEGELRLIDALQNNDNSDTTKEEELKKKIIMQRKKNLRLSEERRIRKMFKIRKKRETEKRRREEVERDDQDNSKVGFKNCLAASWNCPMPINDFRIIAVVKTYTFFPSQYFILFRKKKFDIG